ncbi:GGDEF domain-containing protein [Niveibacterium sp. 24ML]|uniref:GGDEF domain-containing protein n=1 Tax=Niveibacterium sp. 24ML TaxID=2985512 RepID=UPI002270EA98|nr:GGDEF domain-containing protein [Niveibacterium sp. 24ML]MCX9154622.1 GGDEF domain-containing protein [Niveibacterium sp. 24ML]
MPLAPRHLALPSRLNVQHATEHGQALVRVIGGGLFLLLQILLAFGLNVDFARAAIAPAVLYAAFGYVWAWVVAYEHFSGTQRLWITTLADQAIFAYAFAAAPEGWQLAIWAPIFASIGYGLRFGPRAALRAQGVGVLFIGAAMSATPYWQTHATTALGFIASLVLLPQYAIRLANAIAQERELAQQQAREFEALTRMDPLTGVFNRQGIAHFLQTELAHQRAGALLYVDLDGFKSVNDTAGHAAGDDILRRASEAIQCAVRGSDALARLGGDEFAIVLPHANEEDARRVGEKVLEAIATCQVDGYPQLRLGASIGVVSFPHPEAASAAALLDVADARMYAAKRRGKNQLCCEALPSAAFAPPAAANA